MVATVMEYLGDGQPPGVPHGHDGHLPGEDSHNMETEDTEVSARTLTLETLEPSRQQAEQEAAVEKTMAGSTLEQALRQSVENGAARLPRSSLVRHPCPD